MVKGTLKARVGGFQQDLARSSSGELAKLAFVLVAGQAIERISSNDDRWPSLLSVNRGLRALLDVGVQLCWQILSQGA